LDSQNALKNVYAIKSYVLYFIIRRYFPEHQHIVTYEINNLYYWRKPFARILPVVNLFENLLMLDVLSKL